jgi:hypothetical protein
VASRGHSAFFTSSKGVLTFCLLEKRIVVTILSWKRELLLVWHRLERAVRYAIRGWSDITSRVTRLGGLES